MSAEPSPHKLRVSVSLPVIFFLSGGAALIFETVWFRQAGLMLGNGVWASSLVLASFMCGLALGNGLAARFGDVARRPLLTYAALEAMAGVAGCSLVLLFPSLTHFAAPFLGRFVSDAWTLNAVRLGLAFGLMVVPTTAMGMTLPLLVRALGSVHANFGRNLGWLYGWNTLGAVAGALVSETALIPAFGIRGTGVTAGLLDLLAAVGSLWLARTTHVARVPLAPLARDGRSRLDGRGYLLLLAAGLSGATLLALEVVWLRLLSLFVMPTNLLFAVMLAIVLLGIALGGLAASRWLTWHAEGHRWAAVVALFAGLGVELSYLYFASSVLPVGSVLGLVLTSLPLMLPVPLASGVLFTVLGRALKDSVANEARTAGLLTLANTVGAAAGSLLAGFVLLPHLGIERSVFLLAAAYGIVAACLVPRLRRPPRFAVVAGGLAAVTGVCLLLFPFGLLDHQALRQSYAPFAGPGSRLVGMREGLTETIAIFRYELWGRPVWHRLVTNGHSMSATGPLAKRYMRAFVNLPIALRPDARRALLISYGVGVTAEALVRTRGLESVDVVDISRDVLEMSRLTYPPPARSPLDDPRVHVHIEDGRFHLLTVRDEYDLITAEPPPLRAPGVGTLYTQEYFALLRERLADGGVASYWLPVYQIGAREARALVAGFCQVFDDCSLWTGIGLEWMLVGTRGLAGPVPEEAFTRQWRDPAVAAALAEIGLERPELLGAMFIADAAQLREFVGATPAFDDDHPGRLSGDPFVRLHRDIESYASFQQAGSARERFAASRFVRRLWPESLRLRTLAAFADQEHVNRIGLTHIHRERPRLALVRELADSDLRAPMLWLLGSDEVKQGIVQQAVRDGFAGPELQELLGVEMMAQRRYLEAERCFARAQYRSREVEGLAQQRVLALLLAGDAAGAAGLLREARLWARPGNATEWDWLANTLGLAASFESMPPPSAERPDR